MNDAGLDFAMWLNTQTGYVGEVGKSIFANARPSTPDKIVSFTQTPGIAPSLTMGGGGTVVRNPSVQMVLRGGVREPFADVYGRIVALHETIEEMVDVTLNGTRYIAVSPIDEPVLIERDDQKRLLFATNYNLNISKE